MLAGAGISKVLDFMYLSQTESHVGRAERPLARCAAALMSAAALVFAAAPPMRAQASAQPAKEYIYLGGRVIAVESGLAMLSPAPGSTLPGGSVTFTWTPILGASQYSLWIGSTPGATDLGNVLVSTTSFTASLPVTGATVYVRLWSLIGGVWQSKDYTYTEADFHMLTPLPGSTLVSASPTFTWSTLTGATQYSLWLGTTVGGADVGNVLTATTSYAPTVPANGSTLCLRLWALSAGVWQFIDYTYTEANLQAAMITPIPGSLLSGPSATFTWTGGTGVTSTQLWIGTTPGGTDLGYSPVGTATSFTAGLPATTPISIYVRLWSLIGGVWQYIDYTYAN